MGLIEKIKDEAIKKEVSIVERRKNQEPLTHVDVDGLFDITVCPNGTLSSEEEILITDLWGEHLRYGDYGRESIFQWLSRSAPYIFLVKKEGSIEGFAANRTYNVENYAVNQFGGAAFNESIRGEGLFSILSNIRGIVFPEASVIHVRTPNPRVFSAFYQLSEFLGGDFVYNPSEVPEHTQYRGIIDQMLQRNYSHKDNYETMDRSKLFWPGAYYDVMTVPIPETELTKKQFSHLSEALPGSGLAHTQHGRLIYIFLPKPISKL